ncbi:MAG: phage baseplate assembly protein [Methylophilaceae bacterium]
MSNDVLLRVNGQDFGGWKSIEITAGIERQARDFSLNITSVWPGQKDLPRRVNPGDLCELWVGKDKLITGYIDATPVNYDGNQISVGITGRSKTADLVDCSAVHKTGQWRGVSIERIAADLASQYGVKVKTEVNTGKLIPDHQIDTGETVFESIDRLLSLRQLMSTDNTNGDLVFINAGSGGKCGTALVFGENIKAASAGLDFKNVYSTYIAKGQRAGDDNDFGETISGVSANAVDISAKRTRNLVISMSGQVTVLDCKQRVNYERVYRVAKALEIVYTVQGWREENGDLWLPNKMVRIVDPIVGIDRDFLIVEVVYRLNESGTTCDLTVGPRGGYIPSPEVTKDANKKATGESTETWGALN